MTPVRSAVLLVVGAIGAWAVGLGPDPAVGQPRKDRGVGDTYVKPNPSTPEPIKGTEFSVAVSCPAGYAKLVDKVGQEDRCYKQVAASCQSAGLSVLEVDRGDLLPDSLRLPRTADACGIPVTTSPAPAYLRAAATCPTAFEKKIQDGPDVCEHFTLPACIPGFQLKVRAGEDTCVARPR